MAEATVVIELLRDAYALVEFVQQKAHTILNHESEREDVNLKFASQNLRLKRWYLLFTDTNGEAASASTASLRQQDIPAENLELVHRYLLRLQKILVEYKDAAYKDKRDSLNTVPGLPPISNDPPKHIADNSTSSDQKPAGSEAERTKPGGRDPGASKWKTWRLFGRRAESATTKNSKPKNNARSGIKAVAKGVEWLFAKDKLESLLAEFTAWNDDLERTIPYILSGTSRSLRLVDDGSSVFDVHMKLREVSQTLENEPEGHWAPPEEQPMSWEIAETQIKAPRVLVEYKIGPSDNMVYAQQLAWLLRAAGNHKFNTLPFKGFAPDHLNQRYAFLFDFPEGSTDADPVSLHDVILSNDPAFRMSLGHRFHVARTVAASIGAFHADGWYHKSIRSHAIEFFFSADGSCNFRSPYLTEFESSRPEGGQSVLATTGDSTSTVKVPDRDVYLHPDRYLNPPKPFTRVYDIFSLGVVLLEIGLWQTATQIYQEVVPQIRRRDGVGNVSAKAMQSAFLQQANTRLGHRMGAAYREAVEDCLRGSMEKYLGTPGFAIGYRNRIVNKLDIERLMESN